MKHVSDYALIGDLHTAALVDRRGSIEWFCAPRFDASASFAALLGDDDNGFWQIAPVEPIVSVERRYAGDTLVLETDFATRGGAVRVTDFMPTGRPLRTIVRIVEGLAGVVTCTTMMAPKMQYGLVAPRGRGESDGWALRAAPHGLCLHASVEFDHDGARSYATFAVSAGARATFTLQAFDAHQPAPSAVDPIALLAQTRDWWTGWSARCAYAGERRDVVVRSAITLKALSYEPTGSFVAAVTTSLPERIGGSKNWDYRYCWLRDASFSVRALLRLGYADEARRWRDWFETVYVGAPEHLHVMYAVDGERLPQERTLPWLRGFADSRPVRVANDAHDQFQLGVFGDVLTAFERMQHAGIVFDAANWLTVESLMRHVERVWQTPGSGIWETRDGGRQYVDSKVLAWVALERGLAIAARGGFAADTARWRGLQERMHAQVCSAGYDPGRNTFTQYYGSQELDASLLLMPLVGFLPADDPRVAGTIAAIERHLMEGDSVYRYSADRVHAPEGGQPDEGSFTMCGFWLVEAYALLGRIADARALFERLVTLANDVGLFSEELDVARGIAIGNVPQAFSHVGAILAAHRLTECEAW